MLKPKLQYSGHLIWSTNSLEKILMLGKIEGRRRRGQQRMRQLDGIMDWMDMNLSKLQESVMEAWHAAVMGSQRVGNDWATELNFWTKLGSNFHALGYYHFLNGYPCFKKWQKANNTNYRMNFRGRTYQL